MRNLTAYDMLNVWEQGLSQSLLHRVLLLLAAAIPEAQPDTLAKLSIGQRDRYLLQLRERLFGPQLLNTVVCPDCSQRVEWENKIADFLMPLDESVSLSDEFDLAADDYFIRFRLPNSLDIVAITNNSDNEEMQQQLLSRCLLKVEHAGSSCSVEQLPDTVIQALGQRIEALDPHAEIRINLNCPECSHSWAVLFDIASFLWEEINDWAEKILQTVHKLAAGYGWSERDILDLSPVRRQLYLGMLRS